MDQYKACVKDRTLNNELVIRDIFLLPSDVRNLGKNKANELWQKQPKDPISVKMWVLESPYSSFYYVQHALLDLNLPNKDDTPFTFKIQSPW
jgi:hypothetical protein